VSPLYIHKVVRGITTQPYGSYKNEFFQKNIRVVFSVNCMGGSQEGDPSEEQK